MLDVTPQTLRGLREFLFYSPEEAGRWVARSPERPMGVSERTWENWECGKGKAPTDVVAMLRTLVS